MRESLPLCLFVAAIISLTSYLYYQDNLKELDALEKEYEAGDFSSAENAGLCPSSFMHKGHRYFNFGSNYSNAIVHDPDCPCRETK